MAKSTKRGKSRAKKPKSKRPKKVAAAKKPKTRSRKAGASRSLAAAPFASEKNKKAVRAALQACMTAYHHPVFAPTDTPGTWEMDDDVWGGILECICSNDKVKVKFTESLRKKTKTYSFSRTVSTLAAVMD